MTHPTPALVDIEELESLASASAATWAEVTAARGVSWWNRENLIDHFDGESADAEFIAAVEPTIVLALLAELRALRVAVQEEPWQKLHDDDTLQVDEGNTYWFAIETNQGWEYFQDAIIWDSETAPHWNDGDAGWDIDDVTHFMPLPAPPEATDG